MDTPRVLSYLGCYESCCNERKRNSSPGKASGMIRKMVLGGTCCPEGHFSPLAWVGVPAGCLCELASGSFVWGMMPGVESTGSAGMNLPLMYHERNNKLSRPLHSRDTAASPCGTLSVRKTTPSLRL